MLKGVLIGLGTLFLLLGLVGVVLPGLPTTPFVLLAAACYLRSSRKLYERLLGHQLRNQPQTGRHANRFLHRTGCRRFILDDGLVFLNAMPAGER